MILQGMGFSSSSKSDEGIFFQGTMYQEINISPWCLAYLSRWFSFSPGWDMLISWGVIYIYITYPWVGASILHLTEGVLGFFTLQTRSTRSWPGFSKPGRVPKKRLPKRWKKTCCFLKQNQVPLSKLTVTNIAVENHHLFTVIENNYILYSWLVFHCHVSFSGA